MKQVSIVVFPGKDEGFVHEGTLAETIAYVRSDHNYNNYGRNGAQVFMGDLRYEIDGSGNEKHHLISTEYAYA